MTMIKAAYFTHANHLVTVPTLVYIKRNFEVSSYIYNIYHRLLQTQTHIRA